MKESVKKTEWISGDIILHNTASTHSPIDIITDHTTSHFLSFLVPLKSHKIIFSKCWTSTCKIILKRFSQCFVSSDMPFETIVYSYALKCTNVCVILSFFFFFFCSGCFHSPFAIVWMGSKKKKPNKSDYKERKRTYKKERKKKKDTYMFLWPMQPFRFATHKCLNERDKIITFIKIKPNDHLSTLWY